MKLYQNFIVEWGLDDDQPIIPMWEEIDWTKDPIGSAFYALKAEGLDVDADLLHSPEGAILLAEAINWAAKTIDYSFYEVKEMVWIEAAQRNGVQCGWADDDTLALFHPAVGTAHAHRIDPWHPLAEGIGVWPHEWSGVRRQEWAFELLASGEEARELRKEFALATTPTAMM